MWFKYNVYFIAEAAKVTAPEQKTSKITGSKLCVLNVSISTYNNVISAFPHTLPLQSVLTVWQLVEELKQLMRDLPLYSSHFLTILCELLVGYKESLQLLYKGQSAG